MGSAIRCLCVITVRPTGLSRAEVFTSVVRRSGPHLIEASIVPTALFYGCLVVAGLGAACTRSPLIWLYASILTRVARRRSIPPLLVLGAIGMTVRTFVAVASGSAFFYFAQPVATSLVMCGVFLTSVLIGRPMIEKLALEFWPLTPELLALPSVTRLLRGLTYLWAGVNLAIGATTLTLLLVPPAGYLRRRQAAGQPRDHGNGDRDHDRSLPAGRSPRGLRGRAGRGAPLRAVPSHRHRGRLIRSPATASGPGDGVV